MITELNIPSAATLLDWVVCHFSPHPGDPRESLDLMAGLYLLLLVDDSLGDRDSGHSSFYMG
jgi:hypothetical protein